MHQRKLASMTLMILLFSTWSLSPLIPIANVRQQLDLKYQDRGDRYEGIKGTPVSARVELISVVVDHKENITEMPAQFKLKFYLKERSPVFITVREIDNKHNYWLDRVNTKVGWRVGSVNEFQWPTTDVIARLRNIQLYGLGAVVQLDHNEPSMDVRVAPSILYQSSFPNVARGYLFTFKIGRRADVTCSFSRDEDNSPIISTQGFDMLGQRPRTVSWNVSNAEEGWYRLRISVIYSNNGEEVNKIVRFYHRHSIG